jgi:hypothetical protein
MNTRYVWLNQAPAYKRFCHVWQMHFLRPFAKYSEFLRNSEYSIHRTYWRLLPPSLFQQCFGFLLSEPRSPFPRTFRSHRRCSLKAATESAISCSCHGAACRNRTKLLKNSQGEAPARNSSALLSFHRGEAFFTAAEAPIELRSTTNAWLFRASLPQ